MDFEFKIHPRLTDLIWTFLTLIFRYELVQSTANIWNPLHIIFFDIQKDRLFPIIPFSILLFLITININIYAHYNHYLAKNSHIAT